MFFKWFHVHDWKAIARTYVPPFEPSQDNPATYVRPSDGVELNHYWNNCKMGKTTILFECQEPRCRKHRTVEMYGPLVGDTSGLPEASDPPKKTKESSRWKA
jgi:hypothetical protein